MAKKKSILWRFIRFCLILIFILFVILLTISVLHGGKNRHVIKVSADKNFAGEVNFSPTNTVTFPANTHICIKVKGKVLMRKANKEIEEIPPEDFIVYRINDGKRRYLTIDPDKEATYEHVDSESTISFSVRYAKRNILTNLFISPPIFTTVDKDNNPQPLTLSVNKTYKLSDKFGAPRELVNDVVPAEEVKEIKDKMEKLLKKAKEEGEAWFDDNEDLVETITKHIDNWQQKLVPEISRQFDELIDSLEKKLEEKKESADENKNKV